MLRGRWVLHSRTLAKGRSAWLYRAPIDVEDVSSDASFSTSDRYLVMRAGHVITSLELLCRRYSLLRVYLPNIIDQHRFGWILIKRNDKRYNSVSHRDKRNTSAPF